MSGRRNELKEKLVRRMQRTAHAHFLECTRDRWQTSLGTSLSFACSFADTKKRPCGPRARPSTRDPKKPLRAPFKRSVGHFERCIGRCARATVTGESCRERPFGAAGSNDYRTQDSAINAHQLEVGSRALYKARPRPP